MRLRLHCQCSGCNENSKDRPATVDLGVPARVGVPLLRHALEKVNLGGGSLLPWWPLHARYGINCIIDCEVDGSMPLAFSSVSSRPDQSMLELVEITLLHVHLIAGTAR